MTTERMAAIEAAIAEFEAAGKAWTNEDIRRAIHCNKG